MKVDKESFREFWKERIKGGGGPTKEYYRDSSQRN